jgi:hypothetical protein
VPSGGEQLALASVGVAVQVADPADELLGRDRPVRLPGW